MGLKRKKLLYKWERSEIFYLIRWIWNIYYIRMGYRTKKFLYYILDNTIKNMCTKFEINRTNSVGDIWYTAHAEELCGTTNNSAIF